MQKLLSIFLLTALHLFCVELPAQVKNDSIPVASKKITDTSEAKPENKFNPRKATIRSAIIPGWGQIYNKKYWKAPIVWGALGTTVAVFRYNVTNYRSLRQAYIFKSDTIPGNDTLINPKFKNLSQGALLSYRDAFRQNLDYTVLFFLIFWGLNVVDATVDAHLKAFDVNDNLSLRIKPGHSQMANTNGISFVLDIHSKNMRMGK